MKLVQKIFHVVDLNNTESDKEYWLSLSPKERLSAMQLMRQIAYGEDAINAKMEKVLTVVNLSDL